MQQRPIFGSVRREMVQAKVFKRTRGREKLTWVEVVRENKGKKVE